MKRPFTAIEEESADSTSTAAPVSNHNFGIDVPTFQHPFNDRLDDAQNEEKDGSDSDDGLSDSSKRMRRKRNAYQKISDEIRVNLLDAVKNGETLKAAAKRHKINYSSAKSILHTYRKEGRILKKSAQERVTKKKAANNNSENAKTYGKASKSAKKDAEVDENSYTKPKSLEKITKKVKTEMYTNNPNVEEVQPLSQVSKNRANMPSHTDNYTDNSSNNKTIATITIQKGEDYHNKLYNNDHDHAHEHGFSRASSRKGSMQQFRLFDNFQGSYNDINFPDFSTMTGDHYDFNSYRRFSQDFASLNDMVHTLHPKTGANDDHTNDHNAFFNNKGQNNHHGEDQKNTKVENLIDCDEHGKGFMDPQRMFRNTLRKASFLSFGSNTGFRKGSFDLY